jgi:hypothetical protein
VLEIGCRSFNNGYDYQTTTQSVDDNRNGFTIHDGIDVVRVNCLASGSYGPNFADTGTGSSSWNVNCTSRAARGPTRGYGFHALDSASVNTDSCTSLQNLLGQFRAEGSATITDSNSVAFGTNLWDNNSGAGTIAASAVAPISMRGSFDDQQRVLPVAVETSVAQSYTLNGSTRQITATGGALVVVSGSTASTTVLLPANPVLNQRFAIVNPSTVAWTLSGNGFNIDGASTQTMVAGIGRTVVWTGTEWRSPALTLAQLLANANTFSAVNIFSTTTVFGGTAQLQGVFRGRGQQFSGAGTIVSANGFQIEKTGSGAYTLALPTSPTQWDTYRIFDGYGDAGTNNLSVSSSDKAINGTAAGGGAVAAVNTNYGGAWITYDGTKWILSK